MTPINHSKVECKAVTNNKQINTIWYTAQQWESDCNEIYVLCIVYDSYWLVGLYCLSYWFSLKPQEMIWTQFGIISYPCKHIDCVTLFTHVRVTLEENVFCALWLHRYWWIKPKNTPPDQRSRFTVKLQECICSMLRITLPNRTHPISTRRSYPWKSRFSHLLEFWSFEDQQWYLKMCYLVAHPGNPQLHS